MASPRSAAALVLPALTRRYGLVGWPLPDSASPRIFAAAFAATGLEAVYDLYRVAPEGLRDFVAGQRWAPGESGRAGGNGAEAVAARLDGFNVTIPHKVAVIAYLDRLDGEAAAVGAVNTVVRDGGALIGHNTDVAGFRVLLDILAPPSGPALVLGAGGAARAVLHVLRARGHAATLAARHPQSARSWLGGLAVVVPWTPDAIAAAAQGATLLVNTTPVGADGVSDPWPTSLSLPRFVADLVAWPAATPLICRARAEGAAAVGGLPMLVAQAAAAFTLWTGLPAPVTEMAAAASTRTAPP